MRLFELDPNNPIDRELQKASQDATKDGSMDPEDIEAQAEPDDPMGGDTNQPEPAMGNGASMEPAEPEEMQKPVNSALLSQVRGHDYIQNYDHSDEAASTHPMAIMNMDASGLSDLRKRIRVRLNRADIEDQVGSFASPQNKAARDMLAFVDMVMMHKKKAAKDDKATSKNKPRVQEMRPPKTKAGQQFKPRRN